jgi:hypothetical protein
LADIESASRPVETFSFRDCDEVLHLADGRAGTVHGKVAPRMFEVV